MAVAFCITAGGSGMGMVEKVGQRHGEDLCQADSKYLSMQWSLLLPTSDALQAREGVQFMFDCVSGLCTTPNIHGCILADDMGLGKTLQSITLLYTLLCQGFGGKPLVRKSIIVTPTSLVSNWEAEIKKWVGESVRLVALCESSREDVVSAIDSFTNPERNLQVLIVSYETFRMHSSKFSSSDSCDLLICDEAHRLKNDQTITNRALAAPPCKRRILLSGTPLQNDLEEFFAMVNFTNPGILGSIAHFRRYYEAPIICGREPVATVEEKKIGAERPAELSVNAASITSGKSGTEQNMDSAATVTAFGLMQQKCLGLSLWATKGIAFTLQLCCEELIGNIQECHQICCLLLLHLLGQGFWLKSERSGLLAAAIGCLTLALSTSPSSAQKRNMLCDEVSSGHIETEKKFGVLSTLFEYSIQSSCLTICLEAL
ncbi:hypothetical protein V8G54_024932 [Vigna mungo]|uniref:Helicase ATP-binding domain-containing protein n=1 Tax=Vigna mungo TaxID=3915 RepID=A0AAQ3RTW2_VIGMU